VVEALKASPKNANSIFSSKARVDFRTDASEFIPRVARLGLKMYQKRKKDR
jgi:hypothetical protein